nr:ABC transporter permease [Pedobacter panaciterrae]
MFKLNLKIALRNLWKNKGYTFINVFGLSIGMASCILIFMFIRYQLSFDEGYKHEDRIYRFVTTWKYNSFDDYSQGVSAPHAAAAREEIAGLEKVASIFRDWGIIQVKDQQGKEVMKVDERLHYAQPDFFEIFDVEWLNADAAKGLIEPNTVVLSETTAQRFFGDANKAVGKQVFLRNSIPLKVVGVFKDFPENSSFPLKIVISYETFYDKNNKDWGSVDSGKECYVLFKKGLGVDDLAASLAAFNNKYYKRDNISGNQRTSFQALRDIHFNELYGSFAGAGITKKELYGLGIIGLFLIITGCINFINLATAQAINRSKEVGVRKVMGSKRNQLVIQFLTETFAITLIALLIACVFVELVIPGVQNLLHIKTAFSLIAHPVIFLFLAILAIAVSFLAGFYPAMVMSGFSPALAIKNKISANSGGLSMRKVLVVVQFAIAIVLIISTLVIIKQMEYVRSKPLGFNPEAVLMVNIPNDSLGKIQRNTFKEKLLAIPGVKSLSFCSQAPMSDRNNTTSFLINGIENKDFEVRLSQGDENYFSLFDLKIIAGKSYIKSDTLNGYVVNETFVKKINLKSPEDALGKIVTQNKKAAPIIGVVKDFNDHSLKEAISPLLIYQRGVNYNQVAVKMDSRQLMKVSSQIESLWSDSFPQGIYFAVFLDNDINGFYKNEQIMGVLFKGFAGVIIFISFIGLFGLISFVASQRTKEVAIRKVLGASTLDLIKMLNGSFLLMVFIANLAAWPLAYLFVSKWLSGFAYRMDLSIWPFVLAMCISMLITLITVSLRSYKAAVANTIDALKYE